jgi:hypothetical protein
VTIPFEPTPVKVNFGAPFAERLATTDSAVMPSFGIAEDSESTDAADHLPSAQSRRNVAIKDTPVSGERCDCGERAFAGP